MQIKNKCSVQDLKVWTLVSKSFQKINSLIKNFIIIIKIINNKEH